MIMYSEYDIHTLPLTLELVRRRVEQFLVSCGLRLDDVDSYDVVTRIDDDTILAGGGLAGDVIKCVAVSDELRGTGMMQRLLSHLLSKAHAAGHQCVKVFTKPENRDIFESLGFRLLATAPKAIFMENGLPGIDGYLQQIRSEVNAHATSGTTGVIVMNANPFTLGHQALVQWASKQVDTLCVIVVHEDCSTFSYDERRHMIKDGCHGIDNVVVLEGSDYAISSATFPTYFLKRIDEATDTQITLDLDLFARHIAPALNASVRFVGSEPTDALTARYVELMQQLLPARGIEVRVMPRITDGKVPVSASLVRHHLDENHLQPAVRLVPSTTVPELLGHLACHALQMELDTTPKPGLVDRNDNGAHHDMDYATMQRGIEALLPFFDELAETGNASTLPSAAQIQSIGMRGEQLMLTTTQGVNTHKGALFALGLMCVAAAHTLHQHGAIACHQLQQDVMALSSSLKESVDTHGGRAVNRHQVAGALAMAQGGYQQLFSDWLPFYRTMTGDAWQCHKTLLRIMSMLDDTNVIHRVGYDRAQRVKEEAQSMLNDFDAAGLEEMNRRYIAENISPGGAADMLSLTIFVDALTDGQDVFERSKT